MAPNPTADELRALAVSLPPSERLNAAETADVLSAVVAVITHGPELLTAADEGQEAIYEFYHQKIADKAEADGNPAPERGQVVTAPVAPTTTVTAAQSIDYDKLAAAIVKAQQAGTGTTEKTDVTDPRFAAEGHAATGAAPAGEVETPAEDAPEGGII